MEINKQLFEDILSGKLKGTFMLKNGFTVRSNRLFCTRMPNTDYVYVLKGVCSYPYSCNGLVSRFLYNKNGFNIVDFIPDTNMKESELTIEIPEGYCIDKSKSTFEKIVFKKKENIKPKSWGEYCEQQQTNNKPGYYLISESCRIQETSWDGCYIQNEWKNVLPSKELAEAFLAMMQLVSLRQSWIGDWKPDWNSFDKTKWVIIYNRNEFKVCLYGVPRVLSFPTKGMAKDFMNTFKDLLNVAKPLI